MKQIALLGSTGSIGVNTLDVIRSASGAFEVAALAAGRNVRALEEQVREFQPRWVVTERAADARRLSGRWKGKSKFLSGPEALIKIAVLDGVETVVVAIPGLAGLSPTFAALRRGKVVALASKEVIVSAGDLLTESARRHGGRLLPVDSEHSAVFQCLRGEKRKDVKRVILTASGGPFLKTPASRLRRVTPTQALAHPRWKMGPKVSLDSATLMNKGLEVLEARCLFNLKLEQIEVLIHPQSLVHALVELRDGSVLAQLSRPDMRLPIQYALYYPSRAAAAFSRLDLGQLNGLAFYPPDQERFPALRLAYEAGRRGGTMPAVLNAANEVAGRAFLEGRIGFTAICEVVESVMKDHAPAAATDLEAIMAADSWARRRAGKYCRRKAKI